MTRSSVALVDEGRELSAMVSPLRRRILDALREPDSAAGVARRLGLPRQKVNYHLRLLEQAGLVELVEERAARGFTERVMRASARSFVFDPAATGLAGDLDADGDRLSSDTLIALAARTVREVSGMQERASAAEQRLATLSIEGEIRLGSPADLAAFGDEVAAAVARIAKRYRGGGGARRFRFVAGVHPRPKEER